MNDQSSFTNRRIIRSGGRPSNRIQMPSLRGTLIRCISSRASPVSSDLTAKRPDADVGDGPLALLPSSVVPSPVETSLRGGPRRYDLLSRTIRTGTGRYRTCDGMVGSCPAKSDGSNSTSTEERFSEPTETLPGRQPKSTREAENQ